MKVLCDRLHRVEMELTTPKLEWLSAGTHPRVSQSISSNFVEPVAAATSLNPLGPEGHDSKSVITAVPEWSRGSVATKQLGVVTTTLPLLQLAIHVAATTATNTQTMLPSDLRVVPSVQTSREQRHYGMSSLTDTTSNPRAILG